MKTDTANNGGRTFNVKIEDLIKMKQLALRGHYNCEDTWYACPKSPDGCVDESAGEECNCGADKHNAEVESLFGRLTAM